MNSDILIGIAMLVIGGGLMFIGLPNRAGVSPRFLRFEYHWYSIRPWFSCSSQAALPNSLWDFCAPTRSQYDALGRAMAKIEVTPRKLILKAGATTLTLDKDSGKATLQQKMLLWSKKPVEFALSDIDDIAVKSDVDGLSGATIHHSVLHRRSGEIAVLTTEEAKDAAETVKVLRDFVGL